MNKLSTDHRVSVVRSLVEGNSINSTVRMTGISKPTILKLIDDLGAVCWDWHCDKVRNLRTKRVQCDELWAFCYAKSKNVPAERKGELGCGDCWTWTAIDADSKLMVSWMIGHRDGYAAHQFMNDVSDRLAERVQLTSDGHHTYLNAVGTAFNCEVDYAQLHKIYGSTMTGPARYSPPECIGIKTIKCLGTPDDRHISTSYVERANLTIRMGIRRYTRLTNGFSKKIDNHVAMTSIFFTYYNWCRTHTTTKKTPAQAAGLTDRRWESAK